MSKPGFPKSRASSGVIPLDHGLQSHATKRRIADAGVDSRAPRVSVIVPTLDEGANLSALARRISGALEGWGYEILIIDDGSRDGTVEVCGELAERLPVTLHVRSEPRGGLSGAVLYGFARARGEILVVMDGDLQHPPEALPAMLAPLLAGEADFVIGSRRAEGARIVGRWGWLRRANSEIARLLAVPLVGRVRDPMSGFFAVRRTCIDEGAALNPVGYKIALELMCKCRFRRIVEVPIEFGPRNGGRSKLCIRQRIAYVRHLFRLYWFCFRRRVLGRMPTLPARMQSPIPLASPEVALSLPTSDLGCENRSKEPPPYPLAGSR
jgi:dolichol-phosphate mannosyltransferase